MILPILKSGGRALRPERPGGTIGPIQNLDQAPNDDWNANAVKSGEFISALQWNHVVTSCDVGSVIHELQFTPTSKMAQVSLTARTKQTTSHDKNTTTNIQQRRTFRFTQTSSFNAYRNIKLNYANLRSRK